MAKPKPDRQHESLRRAAESLMVDWDTCLILTSKYDPTHDVTEPGIISLGNRYAIERQVEEMAEILEECGSLDTCGPGCDCGVDDEEDDDDDDDDGQDGEPVGPDDDDDSLGNH